MEFSPENLHLRTLGGRTETDQLTKNAIVIGPDNRDFNRAPQECIADTVAAVQRRLEQKLAASDREPSCRKDHPTVRTPYQTS